MVRSMVLHLATQRTVGAPAGGKTVSKYLKAKLLHFRQYLVGLHCRYTSGGMMRDTSIHSH